MSEWHDAEDIDIEIDAESEEVNILVTHNDFGNVYVTITFDKIKGLYDKIKELENKQ